MQTLEQRIERLERSNRHWRVGCILLGITAVAIGATKSSETADAAFDHLSVSHLTIRGVAGGPAIVASGDAEKASLQILGPVGKSSIGISARNDGAQVLLSHSASKGITNAGLTADDASGSISISNVAGKVREIEPE